MICYIPMCVCATITTCLRTNTDGTGTFYPRFHRKHKIVTSCRIFNCTAFGTIKIGIIQHVCKADVVFFIVLDNANIYILNSNFCHYNDTLSFNHKGRYNLRNCILFNGLFTKMADQKAYFVVNIRLFPVKRKD